MIRRVPGHGGFRKGLLLFQRTVISLKLFFPGGQYFCIFEAHPPCEVARMLLVSVEWMQNAGAWLMQMLWARWKSWRNEQNRTSFLQADLHFLYNSCFASLQRSLGSSKLVSLLIPKLNICSWTVAERTSFLDPRHLMFRADITVFFSELLLFRGWPETPDWELLAFKNAVLCFWKDSQRQTTLILEIPLSFTICFPLEF